MDSPRPEYLILVSTGTLENRDYDDVFLMNIIGLPHLCLKSTNIKHSGVEGEATFTGDRVVFHKNLHEFPQYYL